MARVSTYYGIAGRVEFVDVDILKDNRLFVDPRAVRLQSGPRPFAGQANKCTSSFFDEVAKCAISSSGAETQRGLGLLQHFNEPKETRLGLSKNSIDGHGGAEDVGAWIWQVLRTDLEAFLRIGILKWIEDVPVFVYGVDKDITSDLTTRIILEPLAKYTQAMVAKHPEFTRGEHTTHLVDRQVWSPTRLDWVEKALELPVAAGSPLVLVPKNWVRSSLMMSSTRYYETTMLGFVQDEGAVYDSTTGKVLKAPKQSLMKRKDLQRGQATIRRITGEAHAKRVDLLAEFRSFVDARFEPLSEEALDAKTRPD